MIDQSELDHLLKMRALGRLYRGCNGKIKFPSRRIAEGAARARKNDPIDPDPDPRPLHAYRCPKCSKFHFGHDKWAPTPRG